MVSTVLSKSHQITNANCFLCSLTEMVFMPLRIAAIFVVDQMYLGVQLSKRSEFAAAKAIARE
jgi:hypothetical protein